jgi:Tol biopolymer transport system component
MLKKVWRLNSLFLVLLAVAVGGAACGDDDGSADGSDDDGNDDGTEADAGPGKPDAGPGNPDAAPTPDAAIPDAAPPVTARMWVHGDFATNNREQLGAYDLGTPIPASPSVILPPGPTGTLATFGSTNSGAYDVTVDGRTIAYPADVDLAGRYDLYVASTDGTDIRRAVLVGDNARVAKARFSPDGSRIAFTADLAVRGLFSAYVIDTDAVEGTPVQISPFDAIDDVDDLVWTADSSSVLITGDFTQAEYFELMMIDVTGASPSSTTLVSREQILATATAAGVHQPILGRNGRVLFKGRMDADNLVKLYVVDVDGGNLGVLPMSQIPRTDGTTIAEVASVGLSPDGDQLAFGADETIGAYDLWVVPTTGAPAAPTRLTTGIVPPDSGTINPEFAQPLKWRNDGLEIAFLADYATLNKNEPFVVPVDDLEETGQRRIVNIGPTVANSDATAVAWSPDGTQLFLVADHLVGNEIELFVADPALTDGEAALVLDVVESGDLRGDLTISD